MALLPYYMMLTVFRPALFLLHRYHSSVLWEGHFIIAPSCSNIIVGRANPRINILLPAQDIHLPKFILPTVLWEGRPVLFVLGNCANFQRGSFR